jgi:hypothetical protein
VESARQSHRKVGEQGGSLGLRENCPKLLPLGALEVQHTQCRQPNHAPLPEAKRTALRLGKPPERRR